MVLDKVIDLIKDVVDVLLQKALGKGVIQKEQDEGINN